MDTTYETTVEHPAVQEASRNVAETVLRENGSIVRHQYGSVGLVV